MGKLETDSVLSKIILFFFTFLVHEISPGLVKHIDSIIISFPSYENENSKTYFTSLFNADFEPVYGLKR